MLNLLYNTFLMIFTLESLASLVDLLSASFDLMSQLKPLRVIELLLAVLLLVGWWSSRRLPLKFIALPLVFIFWGTVGAMPLFLWLPMNHFRILINIIGLGIGVITYYHLLLYNQQNYGRNSVFLSEPAVDRSFQVRRFFALASICTLAAIIMTPLYTVFSVQALIKQFTAGFITLDGHGIQAETRLFTKGDRQIHLIGMVHVGSAAFFDDVLAEIPEDDYIILSEGISDTQGLFKAKALDYEKIAVATGMPTQHKLQEKIRKHYNQRNADIDLSVLSPRIIELLHPALSISDSGKVSIEFKKLSSHNVAEDLALFKSELIDQRNARLLQDIAKYSQKYTHVVVPWGAAHMPGIVEGITAMGFQTTSSRSTRKVVSWKSIVNGVRAL